MALGISYDESGTLAAYFSITFLSLLLFPFTFVRLRRSIRKGRKQGKECGCSECQKKVKEMEGFEGRSGARSMFGLTRNTILLILGWTLWAFLAYYIKNSETVASTIYDPFEILGLASSSTEKQIKKHYKKLSLKFHPDKIKLGVNQTQEEADAKFVELTKAYKSLTDEAIRENLRLYGNPDGQQPREDKIAIPQWVIEGKNGMWVLGVYCLGLGGGIPWLVGKWWFSQKNLTKDSVLTATAETFFHSLSSDLSFGSLLSLVACSFEFRALLGLPGGKNDEVKSKGKMDKSERKEKVRQTGELTKRVEEKLNELGVKGLLDGQSFVATAASRRALALLWSQVLRIDDIGQEMLDERTKLLLALPKILNSLLQISLANQWLATTRLIMSLSPLLVQGSPFSHAPIAQLPGVQLAAGVNATINCPELNKAGWQKKFKDLGEEKDMLIVEGKLDQEGREKVQSWTEAEKVVKDIPVLEVTDAFFKVDGERLVTPSSIVNFTYSVRFSNPTIKASAISDEKKPLVNGEDEAEGEYNSVSEIEEKVAEKAALEKDEKPKKADATKQEEFAHAPRWPAHRKPAWWVFIGDPNNNRIIVQPQKIDDIPYQVTPNTARTFKMPFQAPPEPNSFKFEAYFVSDTYLGVNVSREIVLQVEPVPEDGDVEDDDISDPEEDTLAGQMAAMRGGKVKRSKSADDESEEEDEEEGSDEEDESSDEDTPRNPNGVVDSSDSDSD